MGAFVHTFNTIAHFQDLAPLQAVDVGHLFYVVEAAGDGKVGGDSFFNKGRETAFSMICCRQILSYRDRKEVRTF